MPMDGVQYANRERRIRLSKLALGRAESDRCVTKAGAFALKAILFQENSL